MSNQFYQLKVKEIVRETADAITIYFENSEEKKIEYKPGQFLTFIIQSDGEEIRRAYSLCTSPFIDSNLGVTVKRVPGGKISNYLNQSLQVGDVIQVMQPIGNFTVEFNSDNERHLIFIGGGSGITPLMSLIKSTLLLEPKSKVSLIYANRDNNSIIFKNELDKLKDKYPVRFTVVHALEKHSFFWRGISGYLTKKNIEETLRKLPSLPGTEFFVCGPEPLMKVTVESLLSLKVPKEKIHKESFESQAAKEASNMPVEELIGQGVVAREVKVIYDGEEHRFIVPPDKTILETALDLDIDLPYSCQSGLCTACRGKCISGKVKMVEDEGLSEREKKEGYVLLCVGHPMSNDVVIEIG